MESVELVTSKAFSQDELITALLQIGVKRDENPNHLWDYVLRRGEAIVWIDPDHPEHYPDSEVDTLIESKLGDPPRTYIVLHISRNPGSEQLALELTIQFAKRWPCVLDNLSGLARRIFALGELQALYESGLGLREDAKAVSLPKEWYAADEEYLAPWQQEELEKQNPEFMEQALIGEREDSQAEISLPASANTTLSPPVSFKRKGRRKRTVPLREEGSKPALPRTDAEIVPEADCVQSVLAEMEPVLREVFLLSAASYSLAEITHLLGYEEGTVTTYLAKARKQFRRLYRVIGKTDHGRDTKKSGAEAHKASQ
jgi:hypothetical protein